MTKDKDKMTTDKSRTFHLGDLISITEGHLVAPNHMDAIYDILGFLTESTLYTHQLPDAGRSVEANVYEQFPFLKEIVWDEEISEIKNSEYRKAAIDVWLAKLIEKYGEFHKVQTVRAWKNGLADF
jgi:hypothetical protein